MTTTVYRWRHTPEPSYEHRADLPTPLVMREISEYRSPIDGRLITSRGERNEDCKRNDAIPWEPGIGFRAGADKRVPGKYTNERFAKKHGLPMVEDPALRKKSKKKEA
jgi:hypothetical protein